MSLDVDTKPIEVILDETITRSIIHKFKKVGITTLESLLEKSDYELAGRTAVALSIVKLMMEKAYQRVSPVYFLTGLELHKEHLCNLRISTGSSHFDALLGGEGIDCGSVTELIGDKGTGKSQLCMTLAVTCQLPEINAGEGPSCLVIDTGGNFATTRIISIAARYNLNPEVVLKNIKHLHLPSKVRIPEALVLIQNELKSESYVLLIVDSATWLFRLEYVGQNMKVRNEEMIKSLMPIKTLASQHRVAVVVTNSTYELFEKTNIFSFGKELVPYADTVMSQLSHTRILITKKTSKVREASIIASSKLAPGKCVFEIDSDGIINKK